MIDYMGKFSLKGKTAAVTGGLGLIGKQVSLALAQAGAKVIVLDINKEKGIEFEKQSSKDHLDVHYAFFDITSIDTYDQQLSDIMTKFGNLHVLVNTAYPRTSDWSNKVENIPIESWRKNIDTHLNAYCLLTMKVVEQMRSASIAGSIINYGSTYGVVGPDFTVYEGTQMSCPVAYSAIKGGIVTFTRYMASYYGRFNIRINCLCPGGIFDNQNSIFVANYEKKAPLKRMGNPDEIAAATLFLASDAASYVCGATMMVDGGWTAI